MSTNWVEEVLERYRLKEAYADQRALALWEEIVGTRIARLTRAVRCSSGTLWVEVSSPAVAQELSYLKEEYQHRLNNLLAKETVSGIRFIPGRFDHERVPVEVRLSEEDISESRSLFQEVEDEALRLSFEELYLTLLKRERSLLQSGGRRCPQCGVAFTGEGESCPGCRMSGIADTKGKD
jgi:hypothetical protein